MTEFIAQPEPEQTPERIAEETDRVFFDAHREAAEYRRPTIPGEHGPGLYYDAGRTVVSRLAPGVFVRIGNFCAFDDPDAVAVAATPQWSIWTDGTPVPPEVSAADAACAALVAVVEGEAA